MALYVIKSNMYLNMYLYVHLTYVRQVLDHIKKNLMNLL